MIAASLLTSVDPMVWVGMVYGFGIGTTVTAVMLRGWSFLLWLGWLASWEIGAEDPEPLVDFDVLVPLYRDVAPSRTQTRSEIAPTRPSEWLRTLIRRRRPT